MNRPHYILLPVSPLFIAFSLTCAFMLNLLPWGKWIGVPDFVARVGGDEFALLLEDRTLPQAIEVAENLRTRLAERPFDTGKGRITLTWSVGVGEGGPGDTVDEILARADAALYDAKLGGRNRVVGVHSGILTRPAIVTTGFARASSL